MKSRRSHEEMRNEKSNEKMEKNVRAMDEKRISLSRIVWVKYVEFLVLLVFVNFYYIIYLYLNVLK